MRIAATLVIVAFGALLWIPVPELPRWGDPASPPNANPIAHHYITQIKNETKVPNLVTAVLADYRGYDTMFETVVVFAAGIAIIAILRGLPPYTPTGRPITAFRDRILQMTSRLLTPVIQLFGLYVVAHGHYSPGGGFQGGVILGASFIVSAISRDLETALSRFPERVYLSCAAAGILVYAGFGWLCQFLGANFLDYSVLHELIPVSPVKARYYSMLGVEIGVALTVAPIMFAIYANLASRGALREGF